MLAYTTAGYGLDPFNQHDNIHRRGADIHEREAEDDDEAITMLGLIMSCSGVLLAWCDEAILHAFERIMIPNMQERPRPIF